MKKTASLFALLAALLLLLTSCAPSIQGEWEYVDGTGDLAKMCEIVKSIDGTVTVTFKSGKMTLTGTVEGVTETLLEADYKTDGKKITLYRTATSGSEGEFSVNGNKLTLTLEEATLNLEKK